MPCKACIKNLSGHQLVNCHERELCDEHAAEAAALLMQPNVTIQFTGAKPKSALTVYIGDEDGKDYFHARIDPRHYQVNLTLPPRDIYLCRTLSMETIWSENPFGVVKGLHTNLTVHLVEDKYV